MNWTRKNMYAPKTDSISTLKSKPIFMQALKAFEMAKTVNWRQLANSGRQADLFMLIRTFSMIINCRRIREECPDWKDNLGAEIHKYFLQVRMDHSAAYGDFEMMVSAYAFIIRESVKIKIALQIERFIAYCVVRGASTT